MGFDAENFGLGLLVGWGSAYAIYRARHAISRTMRSAGAGAKGAQRYATRSTDSRYANDVISRAERLHLAGDHIKLSEILIEPRFIPMTRVSDEEDDERDVYDVVPRVHDHPFLHAPYNLDSLSIGELSVGSRALALLGEPGSGRTTALLAIMLHSLDHINFKPPIDKIQQKIDAEDAKLSEKDRATRIQERVKMMQRAREQLANTKGQSFDAETSAEDAPQSLFSRLMPVYVHMADMILNAAEFGPEVDPAEPLVRAAQYRLGRVAAKSIPRNLYNRLNKGTTLLLIDGFDDLPEVQRGLYAAWLRAFLAQYGQNFMIVAGPATGYTHLTQAGLTPVFLRPWNDMNINRAADLWASQWKAVGGKRGKKGVKPPEPADVERARLGTRALTPMEVTLKLWANYADDVEFAGVEGWLRSYVSRHLPADQIAALLPQMAQVAVVELEDGFITRQRLEALSIGGATPSGESSSAAPSETDEKKTESDEDAGENVSVQGKLLGLLRRNGLLLRFKGERYQFRHPLIAAYLASLTLKDASPNTLSTRAMQTPWVAALGYAAMHTPIDAAVQARLNAKPDLLHSDAMIVAYWLSYASPDVTWRANILKYLSNLLTAPSQYPLLRERAAAALVSTRDRNIVSIFRRSVRTLNADVRRLSCLGMSAVGEPEAIRDLVPLLQDQETNVQLAASMALSIIPHEDALEAMLVSFTEGAEPVRQAIAIAFSAMPDEGFAILHDAMEEQDMMVRRAAIFGLKRIPTTWSLIDIYRAFLEDQEWYVRVAAQQAFEESQYGRDHDFTQPIPAADTLGWLRDWASQKGQPLPPGDGATQMLMRALQEGDPAIRQLSAATLAQLGLVQSVKPLYAALRDKQEQVRSAAYNALAQLQAQIGHDMPAPA